KGATALEIGAGVAIGGGLAFLSRDGLLAGGFAGGIRSVAPTVFGLAMGGDVVRRIAISHNSSELGTQLGSALFDYSLAGASAVAGAGSVRAAMSPGLVTPKEAWSLRGREFVAIDKVPGAPKHIHLL